MTTETEKRRKPKLNWIDVLNKLVITIVVLAIATAVNYVVVFLYEKTTNVSGVFLLSIIIISALTGEHFWGILSAFYSVVATNFFSFIRFLPSIFRSPAIHLRFW